MPRQPAGRAPATPSWAEPPLTVATPVTVTTPPAFATPASFQREADIIMAHGGAAWRQQQQRRFNEPEPLEDSDIENEPVEGEMDDAARAADFDALDDAGEDDEDMEDDLEDEDVEGEDENEEMQTQRKSPTPLPPDLREISSLASWTVSTHKPGCGVAALRNPSPQQFWQSDGPQPHTLTLHFFKVVAIVKIRVYLDFELDESYTPTKMMFFAGMGGNDLVQFATWEGESPCGWVNIPLEGVGGRNRTRRNSNDAIGRNRRRTRGGKSGKSAAVKPQQHHDSVEEVVDEEGEADDDGDDDEEDPYAGNVLKAMVVQVRICENHQNGKDTHVRGFQVFAHDDDRRRVAAATAAAAAGVTAGQPGHSRRISVQNDGQGDLDAANEGSAAKTRGLEEPDWMGEPVIR